MEINLDSKKSWKHPVVGDIGPSVEMGDYLGVSDRNFTDAIVVVGSIAAMAIVVAIALIAGAIHG